ncbi:5'-methylthioadenosine/adenosylhomocysteine nucleosidase [Clostridium hydrogeniformans]|uniref:5'-methylthioadenosine/adenosylhomocysteine nucleosidase n=1 Tax=Clostridium hydrogeniformans TaxID=349933 RepID=UPI0005566F9E|nr:5'-methylthioadenosine/adenosylhomocysteine nucleosidase [Clostridium hydrogeniformans]
MNALGIIGSMDLEMEIIKEDMKISRIERYGGFKFYLGKAYGINIILTSCGIGKVNAASCTQILITKFLVTSIINTGIALSLKNQINTCDIVISDNITYHDVKIIQMKNYFPFKQSFKGDKYLKELILLAYNNLTPKLFKLHYGKIVTGENLPMNELSKASILNNYNPHCIETEGAAIGHVSYINNIPFIIIRCISDNNEGNPSMEYEKFEAIASNNSANLILSLLKVMGNNNYTSEIPMDSISP